MYFTNVQDISDELGKKLKMQDKLAHLIFFRGWISIYLLKQFPFESILQVVLRNLPDIQYTFPPATHYLSSDIYIISYLLSLSLFSHP